MKKVPSNVVKKRSRELTTVFESFTPYIGMEGKVERIWVTEFATDGIHLAGHTKGYIQVLVVGPETMLGTSAIVKITSVGRWSVFGEVIEILKQEDNAVKGDRSLVKHSACSNLYSCACLKEPESCACETSCCGQIQEIRKTVTVSTKSSIQSCQNLIGWVLRRRKISHEVDTGDMLEFKEQQKRTPAWIPEWNAVDKILLGGVLVRLLTIFALSLCLGAGKF